MNSHERLAVTFTEFAHYFQSATPMYAELARSIAHDEELLALLAEAPAEQQMPVLLFASVHSLVLVEPDLALGAFYPSVNAGVDSFAISFEGVFHAFRELCRVRTADIADLVTSRVTQTNEVGRCGLYLPALSQVAPEVGALSLVDVGASAGLNLYLDQYHYTFAGGGEMGPASEVRLTCKLRGDRRPAHLGVPIVGGRLGIDRSPIDLGDVNDRNWLRACVWPEQTERFHRLDAAIDIALAMPAEIRRGDATTELADAITDARAFGHPVVMNSWVLNYFSAAERRSYMAELDRMGAQADLTWVFAESPSLCSDLPFPFNPMRPDLTLLMLVTWRNGERAVRHLAHGHPHGQWMQWVDEPVSSD